MTDSGSKPAEILAAVWRVTATKGLAAVSVRSIAAEAGVSPGRVQHYFATKEDLVRASVELMISSAEKLHRATAPAGAQEELWALLTLAIPQAEGSRAGTSVFYSFVAASVADPSIAKILADAKLGAAQEIGRLLLEVKPGIADSDSVAQELLAVSDGVTLAVLIGSQSSEGARATIRSALNRALASP